MFQISLCMQNVFLYFSNIYNIWMLINLQKRRKTLRKYFKNQSLGYVTNWWNILHAIWTFMWSYILFLASPQSLPSPLLHPIMLDRTLLSHPPHPSVRLLHPTLSFSGSNSSFSFFSSFSLFSYFSYLSLFSFFSSSFSSSQCSLSSQKSGRAPLSTKFMRSWQNLMCFILQTSIVVHSLTTPITCQKSHNALSYSLLLLQSFIQHPISIFTPTISASSFCGPV